MNNIRASAESTCHFRLIKTHWCALTICKENPRKSLQFGKKSAQVFNNATACGTVKSNGFLGWAKQRIILSNPPFPILPLQSIPLICWSV